jgi:hypothetical protein
MNEAQELHCHNCDKYVQFSIDTELNGNHVLNCPNCGHEHCRVVKDGIITGDRWDSRNGATHTVTTTTNWTTTSTWQTYTSITPTTTSTMPSSYLYASWMNTTVYC